MMKSTITVAALAITLAAYAVSRHAPARADVPARANAPAASSVMNFGVDIKADETTAQVGFYNGQPAKGGNDGVVLNNTTNKEIEFTISTPGLSAGTIESFQFFLDCENIQGKDLFHVYFFDTGQGYVRYFSPGYPGARPDVPVEAGPTVKYVVTPYHTDRSPNAFMFSQPPVTAQDTATAPLAALADEIAAGSLKVRIVAAEKGKKQKISGRFDGANLQVTLVAP